jgi:predicted AAA+ superfamily ATPase
MRFIQRQLAAILTRAAHAFPAVVLTGPRRAGKTTLLRRLFPSASYRLLEDPAIVEAVRSDPRGFLDSLKLPVILDEIQNAPELLNYIRARIDLKKGRKGQWLLTGSQDFALMHGVTESMAGRAAVLHLLPLSTVETAKVTLLQGGYPEILARPRDSDLWFQSYLQTYLERDVRQISQIRELATFRRFLALIASRTGQILNKTDLAAPLGVSVPTITEWIGILETTGQVVLIPPYFENFGKRLIKSPKVYLTDSGLACHLLGIDTARALSHSPFSGAIFEGFVASEIVKQQSNLGRRRELYFFRDQRGLEVDFVVPSGAQELVLIEAKASRTVYPDTARSMLSLAQSISNHRTRCIVVHKTTVQDEDDTALAVGARAMSITGLLHALRGSRK